MIKIYETGHVKNVANFYELLSNCIALGSQYNPSNPNLTIAKLQILHDNAEDALTNVRDITQDLNNTVNQRRADFANVKPLSTRIIAAMKSCEIPAETIKNADSIKKKIQGQRATPIKKAAPQAPAPDSNTITVPVDTLDPNAPLPNDTPEVKEIKRISTSQQSYDSIAEHMAKLNALLIRQPNYTITESGISLADIQNKATILLNRNKEVVDAVVAITNARNNRNNTLYNPTEGLCATAQTVKNYLKAAFGVKSTTYTTISKLRFVEY